VHSMKAACQLTGLSPDILRAWERRYGAVQPIRDDNGRRVYAGADIVKLRLLRQATDLGQPIHRVARLSTAALEDMLRDVPTRGPAPGLTDLVTRLLDSVENYRPDVCDEILGLAVAGLSPREAVNLVLGPALVEAGARWHAGRFSAAQEHLLTASVERLVMTTLHTFQKSARGPRMVFGTLAGERHVIGSLLAAFLAASQGVRCVYLGAELPPAELAQAAARSGAAVVVLGLAIAGASLDRELGQLCRELPPGVEVWLGGAATRLLSQASLPEKCTRLSSFDDFLARAEVLRATRP
jgi:DNA-binding transcriptional MerR regulator/methylmalonyl-CoA mutase cobalamin-binding subunit